MTFHISRRKLLGTAGGALLASGWSWPGSAQCQPDQARAPGRDVRAVARAAAMKTFTKSLWVHLHDCFPNGRADVPPLLDRWAEAGFTLLLPYVKDYEGRVAYRDTRHPLQPIAHDWDPLAVINEEALRRGMRVHPWTGVFKGADSEWGRNHPECLGYNKAGKNTSGFLCSAQDAVQDWGFSFYEELMNRYDVAGVHLDYVRYNRNYCWCETCRRVFRRETGVELEAAEPGSPEWARRISGRVHHISRFVRRISDEATRTGKEVSAAVQADYPAVVARTGQDWLTWANERWVDFMMPMNYWSDDERFFTLARRHQEGMAGSVPLIEGVAKRWSGEQFDVSPEHIHRRTVALKEQGYQGVCYFSAGRITDEDLSLIRKI